MRSIGIWFVREYLFVFYAEHNNKIERGLGTWGLIRDWSWLSTLRYSSWFLKLAGSCNANPFPFVIDTDTSSAAYSTLLVVCIGCSTPYENTTNLHACCDSAFFLTPSPCLSPPPSRVLAYLSSLCWVYNPRLHLSSFSPLPSCLRAPALSSPLPPLLLFHSNISSCIHASRMGPFIHFPITHPMYDAVKCKWDQYFGINKRIHAYFPYSFMLSLSYTLTSAQYECSCGVAAHCLISLAIYHVEDLICYDL